MTIRPSAGRVRRARFVLGTVIAIQLLAIIMLVILVFAQVNLDDEPYPCTPTEQVPHGERADT